MPKCEIVDRSDFNDFYTIKSHKVPSKHAEHMHQELMRTQFLTHMLSISIKIPNL
jgi:hypothetical protein